MVRSSVIALSGGSMLSSLPIRSPQLDILLSGCSIDPIASLASLERSINNIYDRFLVQPQNQILNSATLAEIVFEV